MQMIIGLVFVRWKYAGIADIFVYIEAQYTDAKDKLSKLYIMPILDEPLPSNDIKSCELPND